MRVTASIPAALALCLFSCAPTEKVDAPHVYQMGERVNAGHLIYTVFERQWHTEFGTGPDARIPQNRFYLVRLSVVNSGGGDVIIPNTELVDDTGATFPEVMDGDGVQDWIGNTRHVPAAETAQGFLLFDVQPKHYRLQVSGEEGKQLAEVDLPLSFDSDVPDVTTPLDPDKIPVKK